VGKPRPYVPTLGNIIGYFKYQTTKKIDLPVKLWQRNYWERIIRNEKSYQYIADYIINNPAKWEKDRFYILQERKIKNIT
jgi:REP element-mobilizing transposase RayT